MVVPVLTKHPTKSPFAGFVEQSVREQCWLSDGSLDMPKRGKYFSFCSSVPNSLIGCITSDDWTDIAERYPESTLQDLQRELFLQISPSSSVLPFDFPGNEAICDTANSGTPVALYGGPEQPKLPHLFQYGFVEVYKRCLQTIDHLQWQLFLTFSPVSFEDPGFQIFLRNKLALQFIRYEGVA